MLSLISATAYPTAYLQRTPSKSVYAVDRRSERTAGQRTGT